MHIILIVTKADNSTVFLLEDFIEIKVDSKLHKHKIIRFKSVTIRSAAKFIKMCSFIHRQFLENAQLCPMRGAGGRASNSNIQIRHNKYKYTNNTYYSIRLKMLHLYAYITLHGFKFL